MPYLREQAKKKSELYENILSGDVLEYQNKINTLRNRLNLSGSVDAKQPIRDEDGTLVSFESSIEGVALEDEFQEVRLEKKQSYFAGDVDNEFTFFEPSQFNPSQNETTNETTETSETDEETIQFQNTNRDYLIQFINEYFGQDYTPSISTDLLHEKIKQFFSENRSDKKGRNAEGWENFRENKKREVRGISKSRLGEMKKDLRQFRYDDVIENHLYRTLQGQRLWLRLNLPYVKDV